MNGLLELCPTAPDWRVHWDELTERFAWVRALRDTPQNPRFHAEGDVWVHTRMVLEALAASDGFRQRPTDDRATLYLAALLHDVAKPKTTREVDGQLTARGHSRLGERMARRLLWESGAPMAQREQVCQLIRYHQVPFWLVEDAEPERRAIQLSWSTRLDLLHELAQADGRGRVCEDQSAVLDRIALFEVLADELNCLHGPYPFASAHTRMQWFRRPERDPSYTAYDDTRVNVVVLSGLPGAGKDTWVRTHAAGRPTVSLDAWRGRLGVMPDGPQGRVAQAAREEARTYLRAGTDFIWNATNVSRSQRERTLALLLDYGARIQLVYLDIDHGSLWARNRSRGLSGLPHQALERLIDRWEPPRPFEAHEVIWVSSLERNK